jgi:hypothetical protein
VLGHHASQGLAHKRFHQTRGPSDHAGVLVSEGEGMARTETFGGLGQERVMEARELFDEGCGGIVVRIGKHPCEGALCHVPFRLQAQFSHGDPGLQPRLETIAPRRVNPEVGRQRVEREGAARQPLQEAARERPSEKGDAVIVTGHLAERPEHP